MFGRLLSFEPDATGVTVKFEHKEGRISFITDRIVRVYSSMEENQPSLVPAQLPLMVCAFLPSSCILAQCGL